MRLSMLAAAMLAVGCVFGQVSATQAQMRFGFGSSGYPTGGFGYGPSLGGWNSQYMVPGYPYFGNGRPSNSSYYRNNNNYARRPAVVQPKLQADGGPIKIFSPAAAGTPLTYSLDGTEHTIKPGESQMLVNDRKWTIKFDRGGDFGSAEYVLSPGQYWFELTGDYGWELYHDADVSKLTQATTKKNPLPKK